MATPQKKLGSGFGMRSTLTEVLEGVDLTGKLAIDAGEATKLWALSAELTGVNAFG